MYIPVTKYLLLCLACLMANQAGAQATVRLTRQSLMHEMRVAPFPVNGGEVSDRSVSFQWPLPAEINEPDDPLDGMESKYAHLDKQKIKYRIRYARDAEFKREVHMVTTSWAFYYPERGLASGKWFWQYGYVKEAGVEWSDVLYFTVRDNSRKFCPPSFREAISHLPATHPRVWITSEEWFTFREQSRRAEEYKWYIEGSASVCATPMQSIDRIDSGKTEKLENEIQRRALLTRESRRIIDQEESNTEMLIRTYLLTCDKQYMEEAMKRITEMIEWKHNEHVMGDFNAGTMLSLCSMAYDAFHSRLSAEQKKMLLEEIETVGSEFYQNFNNRLECYIADNHAWQMTLRILTMAAFTAYGEFPQAALWAEYCYNLWLVRFPGLNKDGGWHNGDSYFTVNACTLIEVPYFYSRLTGFDFFSDPWYQGSLMYALFQQPPFSKSGGNGSSHRKQRKPNPVRVSYVDALAKVMNNGYAAEYVRMIQKEDPNILKRALNSKAGNLAWFRLRYNKPLPASEGLEGLPKGYVFPATGLASFMSYWNNPRQSAMISFRSSPFGSTSHTLANQNAFNTFYGGQPLFYSSGHHVSYTDKHTVYCHRATRAHNTILVDGAGQRLGVEGYGWIPRHYVGNRISYVVGDASNAYGKVISPLWQEYGKISGLDYSPVNGWNENHLKTFRRHIVTLDDAGLVFIYDELEADTAVVWSYLLHTESQKMEIESTVIPVHAGNTNLVHVKAANRTGVSDAFIFASDSLKTKQTDLFFIPAINWLRADAQGKFIPYENHWHFTAASPRKQIYRFVTIIHTHNHQSESFIPQVDKDGIIRVKEWVIRTNTSDKGKAWFSIKHSREDISISLDDVTTVSEAGKRTVLNDSLPELEI